MLITGKPIDPLEIFDKEGEAGGNTSYKTEACPLVCYTSNGDGRSVYECPFFRVINAWPITECACVDPANC